MSEECLEKVENKQKKRLFYNLFVKLKRVKHLDKILTVLFIAIILLIYFSSFGTNITKTNDNNMQVSENKIFSLSNYQFELENKISDTLSHIKDVGNVKVMVHFNKDIETVIAYTTKIETNLNGVQVETKSPVLITKDGKSEPIILQTIMPDPSSIVVVSTGAKNTNVKLEILRAVQAMFNFNDCSIEIFAGS